MKFNAVQINYCGRQKVVEKYRFEIEMNLN